VARPVAVVRLPAGVAAGPVSVVIDVEGQPATEGAGDVAVQTFAPREVLEQGTTPLG
jgi:hypothetical protein